MSEDQIIKTKEELRAWLEAHADIAKECFVLLKRGKKLPETILSYLDALDVALCYGWIDSTVRSGPDGLSIQRFSPRKNEGNWTELNKARAERLIKTREMTPRGLSVYSAAEPFYIDAEIAKAFDENPIAKSNFFAFPPLYQRVRIDTVQRYKKDIKQFDLRLIKLIENSEKNLMFGEWNDDGKLGID